MTGTYRPFAVLAALCGLAYLPALQAFFVKDDIALLLTADAQLPEAFSRSWPGGFYRPAAELLFAAQYRLFGLTALPYHLVSLAAHLIAVHIAHRLFLHLGAAARTAFAAAAIFALHPLNTESVSWLAGQMSLFSALCALTCLLLLARPRFHPALIPVFALGLGFYENFLVTLPLWGGFILTHSAFRRPRPLWPLLALAALGGAYLYWRFAALDLGQGNYEISPSLETGLVNIAYYSYLLGGGSATGGRVLYYQPEQLGAHFLDVFPPVLLLHLALGAAYLILLYRNGDWHRLRAHGVVPLLWVVLALLPALLLTDRPRRLAYLAVPGYALALAHVLAYLHEKTRSNPWWARTGASAAALLLVVTLYARNGDWQRAGALERALPTVAGDCTALVFDAPNLMGDALFFNQISAAFWIGLQRSTPVPALYAATDPEATGDPDCRFRYQSGRFIPATGAAVYTRGQNWTRAPDAQ